MSGPRSSRRPANAGFTLAEVVAALSVLAIVGAVATPVATDWRNHYNFDRVVKQITFDIARTRLQAIGQNRFTRIRLDGTNRYVRERSEDGVTYVADGPATVLPANVSALSYGATPHFNRQGIANSDVWLVLIDYTYGGYAVLHSNVLGRVDTSVTLW